MKTKSIKRIVSMFLVALLLVGMLPINFAYAEDGASTAQTAVTEDAAEGTTENTAENTTENSVDQHGDTENESGKSDEESKQSEESEKTEVTTESNNVVNEKEQAPNGTAVADLKDESEEKVSEFSERTEITTDIISDNLDKKLEKEVTETNKELEEDLGITSDETEVIAQTADETAEDTNASVASKSVNSAEEPKTLADDVTLYNGYDKNDLATTYHSLYVNYTLADKSKVKKGMTITDMWNDCSDAFIGSYPVFVPIYTLKDNSDYFVAFIDPAQVNKAGKAIYADFTDYDVADPTCYNDIIQYDVDEGIVYIPKSFYYNEKGEEIVYGLEAQVLVQYDSKKDTKSKFTVEIQNDQKDVELEGSTKYNDDGVCYYAKNTTSGEALDITTTISVATAKTADSIDISNIEVYLNDSDIPMEYDGENEFYNQETGELTFAASPVNLYSVFVNVTAPNKAVKALAAKSNLDYAASMNTYPFMSVVGDLQEDDVVKYSGKFHYISGDEFNDNYAPIRDMQVRTAPYCYFSFDPSRGDGTNFEGQAKIYEWIRDGGHSLSDYFEQIDGFTAVNPADYTAPDKKYGTLGAHYLDMYNFLISQPSALETVARVGYDGTLIDMTGEAGGGWTLDSEAGNRATWYTHSANGYEVNGSNSFFALHCVHNVTPITNPIDGKDNYGTYMGYVDCEIPMRILYVNKEAGYAVVGMVVPMSHTQTGAGIYKVAYTTNKSKLSIKKTSTEDSSVGVAGAEYTVYTDSACTNVAKTSDGSNAVIKTTQTGSNVLEMNPGTYYIKETATPPHYLLNTEVYTVTLTNGQDYTLPVSDKPTSYCSVIKTSTTDSGKVIAGAKYALYTDFENGSIAKDVNGNDAIITTTNSGSNTLEMAPGTYWLVETDPPEGYSRDYTKHRVDLNPGETKKIPLSDAPKSNLKLTKSSADETIVNGNGCYSLEGAVYNVYSDEACKNKVGTLTTDKNGNTNTIEVDAGTYYAKEETASSGYALCEEVHKITVEAGKTGTFTCKEQPLNDPFALKLTKGMADDAPDGYTPVSAEGALFQVTYYDNTDGNTSGTPKRTWVFRTDADGKLDCSKEQYLVTDSSDTLYKDSDGDIIYPLGSYLLKEIQAPKYFQLDGTMWFFNRNEVTFNVKDGIPVQIVEGADGDAHVSFYGTEVSNYIEAENLTINAYDKIYRGSVTVQKYDSDGKTPLEGVEFKLVGDDGSEYTVTTDANGKGKFDQLLPQHYVLTETKTVDGHELLKDNIDITIPLEMTEEEVNAQGADKSKAVLDAESGMYCFYDVTYEVSNSVSFSVPMTGGNYTLLYLLAAGAFGVIGVSAAYLIRRKKSKS